MEEENDPTATGNVFPGKDTYFTVVSECMWPGYLRFWKFPCSTWQEDSMLRVYSFIPLACLYNDLQVHSWCNSLEFVPKCCCQRLGLYGGPTSTSIRVGTVKLCCLAMNTPLCLLFLKWESSVGKLCGPIMANDKEYILQCRTCSLLSTPRRDSSFMKLGSAQPKSLSRPFVHQTFRTCNKCSCLFRPWTACQPNLQKLTNACQYSHQRQRLPLIQGNNTLQSNKNRCDPLRLGSKNQSYQSCWKRCALPGSSSMVIISRTSRKQHATTTNSCSVKPHAMLRRFPKLPSIPQTTN